MEVFIKILQQIYRYSFISYFIYIFEKIIKKIQRIFHPFNRQSIFIAVAVHFPKKVLNRHNKHETCAKRIGITYAKFTHPNSVHSSTSANLSRTNQNNHRAIIEHYRISSNRNQSPASRAAGQFRVFDAPKCIRLIKKLPFGGSVCLA